MWLTPDVHYNIMCALRGPDIGGKLGLLLKRTFTAYMRWVVLTRKHVGPKPNPKTIPYLLRAKALCPQDAWDLLTYLRAVASCDPDATFPITHYLMHMRQAASDLNLRDLAHLADRLCAYMGNPTAFTEAHWPTVDEVVRLAGGEESENG